MDKIWIISDTHFNHEAIKKHCNRPYDCDHIMCENMRKMIGETDTLLHLGDVIFSNASYLPNYLEYINVMTKILVKGNHDNRSNNWYRDHGFDFVCDLFSIGEVVFTHIPIDMEQFFIHKMGWKYNVHGHLHNTPYRFYAGWYRYVL